ncbi:MAG: ABC transporter permease subunit [Phycisphaerae bacterium]|nr:ABC transporter permease subunit [Phycisphaerae bacterium]
MLTTTIKKYSKYANPTIITGPIFDKELRVSSRRKRNYILRGFYLIALTLVVSLFWRVIVAQYASGPLAFRVSRMSIAALAITTTIVWFQFIVTQFVAVTMLSTAISDEIYNKTLGVLMSTPITTFQIVMGKLLSKLLQLLLLIALSLPLLSVVRIFGGVPWSFVISSLFINFTAVLFAGSLSMYFSLSGKKAYEVILKTIFTLGLIYLFIPFVLGLGASGAIEYFHLNQMFVIGFSYYTNPLATLSINTQTLISPGGFPVSLLLSWPIHCVIMLGISTLLLTRSIVIVRKVALMQALGQSVADIRKERKIRKREKAGKPQKISKQDGTIRPINCSPVIWKEMRGPMIQGGRVQGILGLVVSFGALLFTYWLSIRNGTLDEDHVHTAYSVVFMLLGIIMSMVLAATTITSEKESRTWPLLMATTLSGWQIVIGKTTGVFKRSIPVWLFLAGHVILFILIGYIHPIALLHLSMTVLGVMLFLAGTGIYFSSCFKRTTTAVIANIALVMFLWMILPIVAAFMSEMFHSQKLFNAATSVNPVVQTGVVMFGDSGSQNSDLSLSQLEYRWPWHSRKDGTTFAATTTLVMLTSMAYAAIGFIFAWRAKKRFRKKIF